MIGPVGEDLELARLHPLGDIAQFQCNAQVRLVRTVAAHGLGIGQARELGGQLYALHFGEDIADQVFNVVLDIALGNEGEFHVQLGELGLPVSAQVLVAEAAGNLVVAVHAGHHQQLLEQLRRLRQRKKLARMHARRHQVIAGTFRRGLGQDRGFDVLETGRIQMPAQGLYQGDALAHALLHHRAAQIQIAILQPHVLARGFVRVEGQLVGLVQDLDGLGDDLDLAGGDARVDAFAGAHGAGHAQAVFVAYFGGHGEHLGAGRVGDHLHDAFMVAQVNKADAAQVAGDIGPAAKSDGLADQGLADEAAKMGAHGVLRGPRAESASHFARTGRPGPYRPHSPKVIILLLPGPSRPPTRSRPCCRPSPFVPWPLLPCSPACH